MSPENVRCLRICGLHMTRAEMAKECKIGQHTIRGWEFPEGRSYSHRPSQHGLRQMARVARKADWSPAKCTSICGRWIAPPGFFSFPPAAQPASNGATIAWGETIA